MADKSYAKEQYEKLKAAYDKLKNATMERPGEAVTRPIAPPQGLANTIKKRNESTKEAAAEPNSYKKGGVVRKTGKALVHKGERVLTKKQASKPAVKKALSKRKGR